MHYNMNKMKKKKIYENNVIFGRLADRTVHSEYFWYWVTLKYIDIDRYIERS